jgi:hypothetical protein
MLAATLVVAVEAERKPAERVIDAAGIELGGKLIFIGN